MANYKIYKNIRLVGTKGDDGDAAESDITAPIGAIFALDSDTVPTGYQETTPPEPPAPPEPDYLYRWDFTKSLVDEVQGKIATLSGNATQGNDGVIISGNNGILNFLGETVLDLTSEKTIEIEFSWDGNSRGTASGMFGVNDGSIVPLLWSNYYGYIAYYKNIGAQYGSMQQLRDHGDWVDYNNSYAFQNNSILKFVFNNDSYDIYKDDSLIAHFEDVILTNCVGIVGKSRDLANSAYVMTIRSIKIYENE